MNTREPPEVVFVREHGSVKSLVAMEQFNRKARERDLSYHAVARRMAPAREVPEAVCAGLRAEAFEISDFVLQLLTPSDVDRAVLVVSFDQDLTSLVAGKVRYLTWDNLPEVLADYPRGRAAIVALIDFLVDELAHSNLAMNETSQRVQPIRELVRYFLRLGLLGFDRWPSLARWSASSSPSAAR